MASETAQRIQAAVVAAMKARDKDRLGVLRMLQAQIKQAEVDTRRELDEQAVRQVLAAYRKKVRDQIASCRDAGRQDLLAPAEREDAIVGEFLPEQLGDAELEALAREAVAEAGAAGPQDMGKVMKVLMPKIAGRADGAKASAAVKKLLAR